MKKVLFVCTGNTCRSPMAMAIFNDIAKNKGLAWQADSAGLASFGDPVNEKAVNALLEIGIKDFNYNSKRVNPQHLSESDLIVVMSDEHKNILCYAGVEKEKIIVLNGGISDPYGKDNEVYKNCLNEIKSGILGLCDRGLFDD